LFSLYAVNILHINIEQQVIIPWRASESQGSSAPPRFDLEEAQVLLRALKQRQSTTRNDDR